MQKTKAFISYSNKDKEKVSVFASLLANNGFDVWMDVKSIKLGEHIIASISNGLDNTDLYILFISSNSNKSRWIEEELNMALSKSITSGKPRIIPVLLDDCKVPNAIASRLYLDARRSISDALEQFNNEFSGNEGNINTVSLPIKPILTGIIFGLREDTTVFLGGIYDEFTQQDLKEDCETTKIGLRKKANGILMNFVPMTDFDLQSPIPRFTNGTYDETAQMASFDLVGRVGQRVTVQTTVFNPNRDKIRYLVENKLDELSVLSLTYIYSIPIKEDNFDKKCLQKIQDSYSIISYDFVDGATIEYAEYFYISVKVTLEQIFLKLHANSRIRFSGNAAKFIPDDFLY